MDERTPARNEKSDYDTFRSENSKRNRHYQSVTVTPRSTHTVPSKEDSFFSTKQALFGKPMINNDDSFHTPAKEDLNEENVVSSATKKILFPKLKTKLKKIDFKNIKKTTYIRLGCLGVFSTIFFASIITTIVLSIVFRSIPASKLTCTDKCTFEILESIPTEVDLSQKGLSTPMVDGISKLIREAQHSIKMLEMYFTLNNSAVTDARGDYGIRIFNDIADAKKRGVDIEIIYDETYEKKENKDLNFFRSIGIKCLCFNFTEYFGTGIMHAKMILVDNKNFFIGSTNMDWRSLSQVEEIGIVVRDCSCLHSDLLRIYETFNNYIVHKEVDYIYNTKIHIDNPIEVSLNDELSNVYFAQSPKKLKCCDRTSELDAILDIISKAKKFVKISVMDFLPSDDSKETYWNELDNALKSCIFRNVNVYILGTLWDYTSDFQTDYLKSLDLFGRNICNNSPKCNATMHVKHMKIPKPKTFKEYEFTRVNHGKFIVTDQVGVISTSNWEKEYFYSFAGVAMVSTHKKVRNNLEAIFERNWNSNYSSEVV